MTNGNEKSVNPLTPNDFGKLKPWCSDASIRYLEDSLKRLQRGVPPVPSFPIYGKRDLSLVQDVLGLIKASDAPDWLKEYEQSRVVKFGPQGGIPKWSVLEDDFLLYKTALKDVRYADPAIIQAMQSDYRKLRAQQLGTEEVLRHLIKSNKVQTRAAGWSEFQLKKTDPKAQQIALNYARNGAWRHGYGYVFSRFNKQKNRIFMPMPFSSMILQAQWFVPFLGGIQKDLLLNRTVSPYTFWAEKCGFDFCFDLMEEELNAARKTENEYVVYFSNDFIKMDTRTGTSQYRNFYLPALHAAFRSSAMDDAVMFTTTAPIISPSGTMTGDHGTASGAEMTNAGETVCNDYFVRRFEKVLRAILPKGWRLVCKRGNGDDSIVIFFVDRSISFPHFEQAVRDTLQQVSNETGFDVQTEKLEISDTFGKFCQNVLEYKSEERKLFWTYPLILILNSIVNPEKEYTPAQWDKDYRDIDIVEKDDNGYRHPAYHAFIDWQMAGLRYPLMGRSEAETQRILSKYDKYRALQSLGERYNRQDYQISSSPTVQYILSKR